MIEKVDVLAEIPYVIKTMVNYVAGTKPYIYQVTQPSLSAEFATDVCIVVQSDYVETDGPRLRSSGRILRS